jgi:hypothetical protein
MRGLGPVHELALDAPQRIAELSSCGSAGELARTDSMYRRLSMP